eukprot:COSAG02_NODE_71007_length_192_cov_633.311828_1_plen_42_part_01
MASRACTVSELGCRGRADSNVLLAADGRDGGFEVQPKAETEQ